MTEAQHIITDASLRAARFKAKRNKYIAQPAAADATQGKPSAIPVCPRGQGTRDCQQPPPIRHWRDKGDAAPAFGRFCLDLGRPINNLLVGWRAR